MNNKWRINQQNFDDRNSSDRSQRREFERICKKFESRIKDKFWWKSLQDHEKKKVYSKISFDKMKESEVKIEIPGNITIKRDLILDKLISE